MMGIEKIIDKVTILVRFVKSLLVFFPKRNDGCFQDGNDQPDVGKGGKVGIAISSGHGAGVRGASGMLDEVREARRVVKRVAEHLRGVGVAAHEFHDDESTTVAGNIAAIVGWHNSTDRDLDVSVHFNAHKPTGNPRGTEVLYLTAGETATRVSRATAGAGGFRDRGAKFRDDLGFLNRTEKPAILLEVCFVDSAWDAQLYGENFDAVCLAIAGALAAEGPRRANG